MYSRYPNCYYASVLFFIPGTLRGMIGYRFANSDFPPFTGGHQVVVARNFLAGRGTQTAAGMTGMAGTVTTGE